MASCGACNEYCVHSVYDRSRTCILGSFFFYAILGEVNGRLPIDERISIFGVNTKVFAVLRQPAQLFPSSRKRSQVLWIIAGGALSVEWLSSPLRNKQH